MDMVSFKKEIKERLLTERNILKKKCEDLYDEAEYKRRQEEGKVGYYDTDKNMRIVEEYTVSKIEYLEHPLHDRIGVQFGDSRNYDYPNILRQ